MVVILITCYDCGQQLPSSSFSPGLLKRSPSHRRCRPCNNARIKKYQKENRALVSGHNKNYRMSRPDVQRALQVVKRAKWDGRLLKTPCVICGQEDVVAHHISYEHKELDKIIWVCPLHNKHLHSGEIILDEEQYTTLAETKSKLDIRDAENREVLLDHCNTPLERALVELLFICEGSFKRLNSLSKKDLVFDDIGLQVGETEVNESNIMRTIQVYLSSRKDDDSALIVTERDPRRMSIAQMRYVIKRIGKRAGVKARLPRVQES